MRWRPAWKIWVSAGPTWQGPRRRQERGRIPPSPMPGSNEPPSIATGLRVLIVDDEKNIRSTLTVCLEGLGAEVLAVGTSEAALAAVVRQAYDIAFVDLAPVSYTHLRA